MKLSPLGLAVIESFEELRLQVYRDQHGVLTIGWGHTGPDIHEGMTCTPEQADAWKLADLATAERAMSPIPDLTQHQYDALVSLVYNIGVSAFERSTMLCTLHTTHPETAADDFLAWNHVAGVVNAGLTKRRKLERALFLDGFPA
jgi:lysozyme